MLAPRFKPGGLFRWGKEKKKASPLATGLLIKERLELSHGEKQGRKKKNPGAN